MSTTISDMIILLNCRLFLLVVVSIGLKSRNVGAFECESCINMQSGAPSQLIGLTCNAHAGADDTQPCTDTVETCEPGVESCTVVTYMSQDDDRVHVRKFCTAAGTPIYQYLLFFPGSTLCQSIDTVSVDRQSNRDLLIAVSRRSPFLASCCI